MSQQPGSALQCTPATYARVFEGDPNGQLVLADLCKRFYRDPYVKGGAEAERETLVRLGNRQIVEFILKQIGRTPEDDDAEA
jgi:hypothetical protein